MATSTITDDRSNDFDHPNPYRTLDDDFVEEIESGLMHQAAAGAEIAAMMDALGRGDIEIFTYLLTGHLDGDEDQPSSTSVTVDPERRRWLVTVSRNVLDAALRAATTLDDFSGIADGLDRFDGEPADLAAEAIELAGLGCDEQSLRESLAGASEASDLRVAVGGPLAVAYLLITCFTYYRFDRFFPYTQADQVPSPAEDRPAGSFGGSWPPDLDRFEPSPEDLELMIGQTVITYFGDDQRASVELWEDKTEQDAAAAATLAIVALGEWMWNVRARGDDPVEVVQRALEDRGASDAFLHQDMPSVLAATDGIDRFARLEPDGEVLFAAATALFCDLEPSRYGTEIDVSLIQDEVDDLRESLMLRFPSTRASEDAEVHGRIPGATHI